MPLFFVFMSYFIYSGKRNKKIENSACESSENIGSIKNFEELVSLILWDAD